jgi:hypothetical protein
VNVYTATTIAITRREKMPKHDIKVQLSGEDGNIFSIMGRVTLAMKRAGLPAEEREEFARELTSAESYDAALQCVMRWVRVA